MLVKLQFTQYKLHLILITILALNSELIEKSIDLYSETYNTSSRIQENKVKGHRQI